jgi:uncharacterized membrane protein YphA (DoxX/SURF4 family)
VIVAAWAAAAVLAYAGAAKLLDPTMLVGAMRAMGLPSSPLLVRAGAAAEVGLGVAAVVVGGPLLWALVGVSYTAFAGFVVAALRSDKPIGSCGCFGRADTPATVGHVLLNVALGAAAYGYAAVLA